jgi:hypothetical protein
VPDDDNIAEVVESTAERLDTLSELYQQRMAANDLVGAVNDIGELIQLLGSLIESAEEPSPDTLVELARLYALRSSILESQRAADLDSAIYWAEAAIACLAQALAHETQADGAWQLALAADAHLLLGLVLLDRYAVEQDGDAVDPELTAGYRDAGIAAFTDVMTMIPRYDPAWLSAAAELGHALHDRFVDQALESMKPDLADLDYAIDLLLEVANAEPEPEPVLSLAMALSDRLGLRPDDGDVERLITWCSWLLDVSDTSADGPIVHDLLGAALLSRADSGGPSRQTDLDAAMTHLEVVLARTDADDPDRGPIVARLAHAYCQRVEGDASRHGLVDQMTAYAEEAWTLLPSDDEDRPAMGWYLVGGIHERMLRPGAAFDLPAATQAIEVLTQLASEATDEQAHLDLVLELGHFLVARGQATGSASDLLAAQPLLLQAVAIPADAGSWSDQKQTLAADIGVLASLGLEAENLGAYGGLLIQRAGYRGSREDLDRGIAHLTASYDQSPAGHPYRIAAAINLAGALLARFQELGQAEDVDAARFYLGLADALTGPVGDQVRSLMADVDLSVAADKGLVCLVDGMRGDRAALDGAVSLMRRALAMVPPGSPYRHRIGCDLGLALTIRASQGAGSAEDLAEAAREIAMSVAASAGTQIMRPISVLRAGGALIAAAVAAGRLPLLRDAIGSVTDAVKALDPRFGGKFRFAAMLGMAALALHRDSGERDDLDTAVSWLESAIADLAVQPFHPQYANCMMGLAQARRAQDEKILGCEAGFAALRARARELLLQTGTRRSITVARLAAAQASEVAEWCLDDHEILLAVQAIELGRGLILHAATAVADLPAQLTAAGENELADEWRRVGTTTPESPWDYGIPGLAPLAGLVAGIGPLPLPDDLRARTLAALKGSTAEQRLLDPPSGTALAGAIRSLDADALVYLLGSSAGSRTPGRAVIVRSASGQQVSGEQIILTELCGGPDSPLDVYRAAFAAAQADDGIEEESSPDWNDELAKICDWAWPAAMEPILGLAANWELDRPPRLVLIPVGDLSIVPWHAARSRLPDRGPARYVVHDAVISYAASGRQLCEVASRSRLPLMATPAVVADPTGSLRGAVVEAEAIAGTCYGHARYFGSTLAARSHAADGPGTPREVLNLLPTATSPGASVLHLGCHAVVSAEPGQSRLILADQEELRVDAILAQASGRPLQASGGLVSLAACSSDVATSEYDEALTLATSFLAAGAVTVVGARWPVPDQTASLLMFMFHYLMAQDGHPPGDALRLAQLWLLDPGRTAPSGMPAELARRLWWSDLDAPILWAGFVHQGR